MAWIQKTSVMWWSFFACVFYSCLDWLPPVYIPCVFLKTSWVDSRTKCSTGKCSGMGNKRITSCVCGAKPLSFAKWNLDGSPQHLTVIGFTQKAPVHLNLNNEAANMTHHCLRKWVYLEGFVENWLVSMDQFHQQRCFVPGWDPSTWKKPLLLVEQIQSAGFKPILISSVFWPQ